MSFIVAGNWKMFKGPKETESFFTEFNEKNQNVNSRIIFFVPAVNAQTTALSLMKFPFFWGPQNIYPASEGAFTGEISPQVMQGLGAQYALIGHSERRSLFAETDELINKKIKSAQEFNLNPMLCIGESLEERKKGATLSILKNQLEKGLADIEIKNELHIAYEPVWAIGTGEVATVEQVSLAHQSIRDFLKQKYPEKHKNINILYGGSVKPENAKELSRAQEVGGFLVGGASLKPQSFSEIIKASEQ